MAATIVATHERATAAERILRAAVALFRERGYHGSSMRTLARALRMEAASLYYHFKSKQEILFAILDRTLDDLLAGVGRRSEEHTSELQSPCNLVCRLLLEKKKKISPSPIPLRYYRLDMRILIRS